MAFNCGVGIIGAVIVVVIIFIISLLLNGFDLKSTLSYSNIKAIIYVIGALGGLLIGGYMYGNKTITYVSEQL